jgi:hypothetical protein
METKEPNYDDIQAGALMPALIGAVLLFTVLLMML